MNRTKLIRIFGGLILIIFVAMGASGGCEKNNNSNGGNDGDDNGTTFNGTTLGVCDLSGADTICQICANDGDQACCKLGQSPPGCGTIESVETFTLCHNNLQEACRIVTPTPPPSGSKRTITFMNNCGESIWVGGQSISFTRLLCEANTSLGVGDCGPKGGQSGGTIMNNTAWVGPPPWGVNGEATWKIPSQARDTAGLQGKRQLTVPNCWDSGSFYARTGCTEGAPGELTCQTANCGFNPGVENCGGIDGNKPTSLAEMTFNGGIPKNCNGKDNYDVSFVAGFTELIYIEPDTMDCPTAGSGCMELPTCPWDTFVYEPNDPDQIGGFVTSQPGEIAVCFSPFNMLSIGLAPFDNFNADEMDRLGCTGQYVITPWTNIDVWGVCMLSFGDDSSSCALSAPEMCSTHTNVLPLGNSTPPCCSNPTTMCDPYGQCDQALGRTAAWPDFNDNGMMNPATVYIDNIHTACGDNSSGSLGAYAWSFDDGNQVLGLSDALKSCNDQSANYTITFCADGSNM